MSDFDNVGSTGEKSFPPHPVDVTQLFLGRAEEALDRVPPRIREIFRVIVENIELDVVRGEIRFSVIERVDIPRAKEDLIYAVEVLIHRVARHLESLRRLGENDLASLKLWLVNLLAATLQEAGYWGGGVSLDVGEVKLSEIEKLYYKIAKTLLASKHIKTFYMDGQTRQSEVGIYCFNGVVYKPCDKELEAEIERLVGYDENLVVLTRNRVIKEVMGKIKRLTYEKLRYEPLKIAFRNTVFDWKAFLETGSILDAMQPPSPDLIVFHEIPHRLADDRIRSMEGLLRYDDSLLVLNIEELAGKLCPRILETFKAWVGGKWILLFEIIGYTLYPRYDMHKAVMLVGEGSNGKSTYLRLVEKIIGSRNKANVSLQELTDTSKRFVIAQLYRRMANIYADLPDKLLRETGRFKLLTGEDSITADRKFKDSITFTNYAKLLFSTNKLPKVKDMTSAFWRRWIVVEFPNKFEKNPGFFEETFTEDEIEGAIIVSMYAFRNAWLRKRFSFEGEEGDTREKWLRVANSVYGFVRTMQEEGRLRVTRSPYDYIPADELYGMYSNWVLEESGDDWEPVSKRKFTEELNRWFGITKKQRRVNGKQVWCYIGIDKAPPDYAAKHLG